MRRGLRRTQTAHTASRSNSAPQHPARASRTAPPRDGPPPAAPAGRDALLSASATAAAVVSSPVAAHLPAAPGGSCTQILVLATASKQFHSMVLCLSHALRNAETRWESNANPRYSAASLDTGRHRTP